MGLFRDDRINEVIDLLKGDGTEKAKLNGEIKRLKKELVDLEIQRDRLSETHEREQRDLKHMIGLEKKRQEFEIESAKRETTVSIREENLTADRKRFEDQMDFTTKRFEQEVGYLKDIMVQVLDRLPTVNVDRVVKGK